MRLLLRLLAGGLVLVAVAIVALAVALWLFVEPEDYREAIAAAVESQTGRRLEIDGGLELDFLPCCGLAVNGARLGNPPGFGGDPFVRIDRARLGVRVWPLLVRRELVVGELALAGPELLLRRTADGRENWVFDSGTATDGPPAPAPAADDPAAPALRRIEGLSVTGGRVRYVDEAAGSDVQVEAVELVTGAVRPGEPFPLRLGFTLRDASSGLDATAALTAQASVDAALTSGTFEQLDLELAADGPALEGVRASARLGAVRVDARAAAATTVEFAGLTGEVALRDGPLPDGGAAVELMAAALGYDLDSGRGRLEDGTVTLRAAGVDATVSAAGAFAADGGGLGGSFRVAPFDPRALLAALGEPVPATTDPTALTEAQAAGNWTVAGGGAQLTALELGLDATRMTGTAAVENFASPAWRFDLDGDAIDIDRYLAPDPPEDAGSPRPADAPPADDELPIETLRELEAAGVLRFDSVRAAGLELREVELTLAARDGVIRLDPLSAGLYDGVYRGVVTLDATGGELALVADQRLEAVQMRGLLGDLAGVDRLRGLFAADAQLRASGTSVAALLAGLDGQLSLALADGVYEGLDLWYEIRAARARLRGEPPPERAGPVETPITTLDLGGMFEDGVLNTERLAARIPFLRIAGRGRLGLVDESLDYRLDATVVETPSFEDGEALDDLRNLTIPLTLTGTLEAPRLRVELKTLARDVAAGKLREKLIEKLGGDEAPADGEPPAEESPRDALKRGLKDLLRR